MLIVCHGLPKSASTFMFELLSEGLAADGYSQTELRAEADPYVTKTGFLRYCTDEAIHHLVELAQQRVFAVKTHDTPSDNLQASIEAGDVRVVITDRNPYEAAMAALDAGKNRPWSTFAKLKSVPQALEFISRYTPRIPQWQALPGPLYLHYDTTRDRPSDAARALFEFAGIATDPQPLVDRRMANKDKIGNYGSGARPRGLEAVPSEYREQAQSILG